MNNVADDITAAYNDGYEQGLNDAVVHGHWVEAFDSLMGMEYFCSECGCYALYNELTTDQVCTEYCPNCGARMDG